MEEVFKIFQPKQACLDPLMIFLLTLFLHIVAAIPNRRKASKVDFTNCYKKAVE